jgi:hypothetical protein
MLKQFSPPWRSWACWGHLGPRLTFTNYTVILETTIMLHVLTSQLRLCELITAVRNYGAVLFGILDQ